MSSKRFYYVACGLFLTLIWAVADLATPPTASSAPFLTPTPAPTPCPNNYNYTVSTGTIVSGTTLVAGSQCGSCVVNVALPFTFAFYGQTYTSANLSTQGNLQFTTTHLGPNTCPLPQPLLGPAMMPHWDEFLETSYHGPCQAAMGSDCGIYTSVSGSAPNRVFNIEWRARFFGTSHHTANFEIRMYENSAYFEYIYGWVSYTGGNASIGVQDGVCRFTSYSCNTWNNIQPGTRIVWGGTGGTVTPTPTPACCNNVIGTVNSYCQGSSYRYTFGLTNSCSLGTTANGGLFFEVSPNSTGPWTSPLHIDYFNYQIPPGYSERSGSLWSGALPPGNNWFRYRLYMIGNCWTVNVASAPQPACVTGTVTPGTITPTPTRTYTRTTTATPETTHTATVTGTPVSCNVSFIDVPPDNTFYTQVRCLTCRGIVSGYLDGTFRPNNQVTRGQLAKMVSNAAGFFEPASGQTFQDVPPTHTFYEFIQRLTTRGYMTGYLCGGPGEPCVNNRPYFRPQNNATRGQTSKIVANAAQIETPIPHNQQTFEDVPPTHTFWLWIERLATRNVMTGYECGRPEEPCIAPENRPYFRPGNDMTRGQTSKIVANTFFPNCEMRRSR